MKISVVNQIPNYTHFSARKKVKANQQNHSKTHYVDNKKLFTTSCIVGAVGAVAISAYAIKTIGVKPKAAIGLLKDKIKGNLSSQDPLEKILKGKRDAAAVQKYNKYLAQKKLAAFDKRIANGEFNNKPQQVYDALRKNRIKLSRTIGDVSGYIQQ